jgi:hypothetical protein
MITIQFEMAFSGKNDMVHYSWEVRRLYISI